MNHQLPARFQKAYIMVNHNDRQLPMIRIIRNSIVFLTIILLAGGCTIQRNPVSGNKRLMAYSWNQEVQIGQEVDKEFTAQYGLFDDYKTAEFVDYLGHKLLEVSHMRREDTDRQFRETEFYFRVLDSPVVNAFALPGGYVYVTRGLLAHLNNEAQLAMVVGHEIGHVAARHASQRAMRQSLGQIAIIGGAVLGQEFLGLPGESILNMSSQAAQLIFLSYGRDAERESDRLGVEYAAKAGYAAGEGAAFFTSLKRISEDAGHSIPSFLSSHPDPGEREKTIPELAREWAEKGYEQTEKNEEQYMELLDGMIFGENPREGFLDNDRFVHPELAFQFSVPDRWRLINERQQVILVSSSENAVMIFRIDGESESARESVEGVTAQEGVSVNSSSETRSSGRYTAYKADATIEQDQEDLRALIWAVEYDDRIYRFINYTPVGSFEEYESAFTAVPESFDELTDRDILDVRPVTLQVTRADRDGRFEDFLPDELPMNISAEQVAIINQAELDEQIESGRFLKIPVQ